MTAPTLCKLLCSGSALVLATAARARAAELTVALYAPSMTFESSTARLEYVQNVAREVAAATGAPAIGRAFVRYDDLRKARPDVAIIDGLCLAERREGTLIAVAQVGGETAQRWALLARPELAPEGIGSLSRKRLAFVSTGCRDRDFLANALFEGEVALDGFAGLVGRPDLAGAIAAVRDYKTADAVFAPVAAASGLVRVFESRAVPTAGCVVRDAALAKAVRVALSRAGVGGAIDGWRPASEGPYEALAARLLPHPKTPLFAAPARFRLALSEALVAPPLALEPLDAARLFQRPPATARARADTLEESR